MESLGKEGGSEEVPDADKALAFTGTLGGGEGG